ncbi:MAG: class I SAM-dependent methyltransferase, partial [Pseudomonadota bacterium]
RSQRLAEQRYKRYKPLIPDGARVLDFGSGSGEFLNVCKNAGCDVLGIEPGMSYSNFARSEYSVDVISKSWTDVDLGDRKFDFISSFHVFEHLRDPKAALEFLLTHLYPDGAIVLEVPNMLPTQQKLFERLHFAHVHGFTPMSMTSLGASVGLIEDARVPSKSCDFAFRRAKKGEVLPPVENPAAASVLAETYDTASPVRHVLGFGWVIDAYHRVARDVREMAR